MKITKHRNGGYSITGVTRDEIGMLSFAALVADHWHQSNTTPDADGWRAQWEAEQRLRYARLREALEIAESSPFSPVGAEYLPSGRSLDLDCDLLMVDRPTQTARDDR